MSPQISQPSFDIALSFAGAQRSSAHNLYVKLIQKGLTVFYDKDHLSNILGKDLYQYLSDIYQNKAKYCVLFLSKEYANEMWTRHELKSIQARAFKESQEYILPIRFDNTEIPGLLHTIAYLDIKEHSLEEIAKIILEKVNSDGPLNDNQIQIIDKNIEISLAEAVIWADEYLRPQPLNLSDYIAQSVRNSFDEFSITPNDFILKSYLINDNASFRVVGYLGYQIKPFSSHSIILNFIVCLNKERVEASTRKETRPLWQLIICIGLLLRITKEKIILLESLRQMLAFMETDGSIDVGGECKHRIRHLIQS